MKNTLLLFVFCFSIALTGQSQTKKALFLGNSYTSYNSMPQMVADMASSTGDVLNYDSNTPGGYPMGYHTSDSNSLRKLAVGDWDYVVLQDQSQFPAAKNYLYLYSTYMDSLVKHFSGCSTTLFYMTWGRKNGMACTATWPYPCTYMGMDSLLRLRYLKMTDTNKAEVSPVGAVWRYIRQNHPNIELYQSDESHPTTAGSYAAACSFYTAIFRKDPSLITFNSSLSATEAATIRNSTKIIVYDSLLKWSIGKYDFLKPQACGVLNLPSETPENEATVFPNPVTSILFLSGFPAKANSIIQLLNASGQLVREQKLDESGNIDVSKLPAGVYFLKSKDLDLEPIRFIKN